MQSFIDNLTITLNDELESTLGAGGRLSNTTASFSFYAYESLKKNDELRFLFTKAETAKNNKKERKFYIHKLNRKRSLYGSKFEIKLFS